MKGGFEGFDVVATVAELKQTLVGCRLVNAYDSNNKIYMLKFACTTDDSKPVLLLESGVRMHLTSFSWPKGMMPLGFTMKLRKHIKNKKLASIRQLGVDRLVDLQFGFDEYAYHLIVELYGKGNIFLTDAEYMILHLLRPRTDVNQDVRYAAHQKYPVELARPVPECLLNLEEEHSVTVLTEAVSQLLVNAAGPWNPDGSEPAVTALSTVLPFGTGLLEHCCCVAGLVGSKKPQKGGKASPNKASSAEADACRLEYSRRLATELRLCLLRFSGSSSADSPAPPAVILGNPDPKEPGKLLKYDAFHPFLFTQFANRASIEFPTFNKAVDEFFSSLESQRAEVQIVQNEKKASKRLENVKKDQEQRLKKLQEEQVLDNRKAELLELNADLVDKVLYAINYALANQTSWNVIEAAVAEQKARGDPVSSCIERLQLDLNQAVLRLSDPYVDDDEDEDEDQKNAADEPLEVTIDLGCNALQNAKRYYDHRRLAHDKEKKTITGTKRALKMASKKAEKTKTQVAGVQRISKTREPFWFEKFHWFISSDNYLVLAGRDAGQNENLIKRYFRQHDIYVHADVHGASSVIVKARPLQPNEPPDPSGNPIPLPPMRTLIEAGHMAVTLSNAWTAKVITNAWWVRYDQVSKTAPSGEYLTTGSFVIRGRKNLLPQCHLTYGFSVLFGLAEDSLEHHKGERCIEAGASADLDASLKKYECPSLPETKDRGEAGGDSADELAQALDDVTLKLNINRGTRTTQGKPNLPPKNKPQNQPTARPNETVEGGGARKPQGENKNAVNAGKKSDGALKRGQKAKAKRIKEKYGDQDEEERNLCLFLLQGASAKPSALHSLGQPKPTAPSRGEAEEPDDDEEEKKQKPIDAHSDSDGSQSDADNVVPPTSDEVAKDEGEEEEELEGDTYPEKDRSDKRVGSTLEVLNRLTGQPTAEDTILFALPFCAPYSAISKCKFKAKLTPGTQKRGKIGRLAIHHFAMDPKATPLEQQLLKSVKEEDICRVFPGSAKLTFPEAPSRPSKAST